MKFQSPPTAPRGARFQALLALAATCFPVAVQAVSWDNSAGDGSWSSAANWDTNVEPTSATPVIFPAPLNGPGVTLSSGEQAASLQFDESYTLTGGTLALPAGNSINVASGITAFINSQLTLSAGLSKSGTGTLVLFGTNTIPTTTIQGGKISAISAGALGGGSSVTTVNGGSTLELANGITLAGPIVLTDGATLSGSGFSTASGAVSFSPATTALTLAAANSTDTLVLAAGGNFTGGSANTQVTIAGSGKVRVSSASTFDGSWLVPAGSFLELASATALGDNPGKSVTLSGGTLSARPNAPTNFTSSQANNIVLTASSTLLSDRSTIVPTSHNFGSLSMGAHTLTVAPGSTPSNSGTAEIVLNEIGLSGNPTFTVNDRNAVNGKLSIGTLYSGGVARPIVKTGDGDISFANSGLPAGSTYSSTGSGITELLYPNLGAADTVNVATAQNPLASCPLNLTDGGLRFVADGSGTNSQQTYILSLSLTLAGNVTLDADRRSGSNANKTFQLPGLTLPAGSVLNISGANTHGLRLSGGLSLQGNATIQGTSMTGKTGLLTIDGGILGSAGTQLSIGGGTSPMSMVLNAAGTYGGGTVMSGSTVTLNAESALGPGPLTLSGGTLIVNADDALNGTVTVNGGTLRVNDIDALDGNAVNVNNGTLDLRSNTAASYVTGPLTVGGTSTLTLGTVSGPGSGSIITIPALNVSGTTTLIVPPQATYNPNFSAINLGGDLTLIHAGTARVQSITESGGPRLFAKAGAGTLEMEAASTYSGGTEIREGKLQVEHSAALGTGTLNIGAANGSSTTDISATFNSGLTVPNDIIVRWGASGTRTMEALTGPVTWNGALSLQLPFVITGGVRNGAPLTYAGLISGANKLIKGGEGELVLGNPGNTFGDGTPSAITIVNGSITVASDEALGNPANGVTLGAAGLKVSKSFSTARTFTPGSPSSGSITVVAGEELTMTAPIGGKALFSASGEGLVTFAPGVDSTPANGLPGQTQISRGTVRVQGAKNLGTGSTVTLGGFQFSSTLELLCDPDTPFNHPITVNTPGGTILADRAIGGSGTNGRHTLGTLSLSSSLLTVNGGHGYGLSFGPVTIGGNNTLTNNTAAPLILASLFGSTSSTNFTMTFAGDGDFQITGSATEPTTSTGNFRLTKNGAGTLRFGTSLVDYNALTTVTNGTLDLNGLNHNPTSVSMGGVPSATGAKIITGASGTLSFTGSGLTFLAAGNPAGASVTGNVGLGDVVRGFYVEDSSGAAVDFLLDGPISGNAGSSILKYRAGTMRMTGAGNTQPGSVSNYEGTLELAKSSGDAIGTGGLIINGGVVSLLAANQINDSAPVTVESISVSCHLDLAGQNERTGAVTLTQASAPNCSAIKTGAGGTLVLNGNLTFNNNTNGAGTSARNVLVTGTGTLATPSNTGTLDLGGAVRTIHCASTTVGGNAALANATIETRIINGGIIKTGARTLYLTNPNNSFAGGIQVNQGTIRPTAAGALGTGPLTFANAAGVSAGLDLTDMPSPIGNDFVIGGAGAFELTYAGEIPNSLDMQGDFLLQKDLAVNVVNGTTGDLETATLHMSGVISDGSSSFGLIKKGNGVLSLAPGNAFSGPTTIQDGVLRISGDTSLGDSSAALTINGGALGFDPNNTTPVLRNVVFGPNGGGIRGEDGPAKTLSGNIDWGTAPANAVYGKGTVILEGSTTGGAATDLQLGRPLPFAPLPADLDEEGTGVVLSLRGTAALPDGNLKIENGAVLELGNSDFTRAIGTGPGQFTIADEEGGGWAARGVGRHINLGGAAAQLSWGQPGFLLVNGPGVATCPLILGSSSSTHTLVFDNPLDLNQPLLEAEDDFTRNISIGNGSAEIDVRMAGDISAHDLSLPYQPLTLSFTGPGGTVEIAGDLLGDIQFNQDNPTTIIFSGDNELHDDMVLHRGIWYFKTPASTGLPKLLHVGVNGAMNVIETNVPYAVDPSGSMRIDGLLVGAVLAAQDFAGKGLISEDLLTNSDSRIVPSLGGTLHVGGNFHHIAGAQLEFGIDGLDPATGYTRMRVVGEVNLAGEVKIGDFAGFAAGQSFVFLLNEGDDPIVGQFAGLPEGAMKDLGNGLALQFTYQADGDSSGIHNDFGATVVQPGAVDRAMTGSGPLVVTPGAEIVLDYDLTTGGPATETTPQFNASFPATLTFTGSVPYISAATANSLTIDLPEQAPGSTTHVQLHFTAPLAAPSSVKVDATYNGSAPDVDGTSPTATLVTAIFADGYTPLATAGRHPQSGDFLTTIPTLENVHYLFEGSLELEDWYPIQDFIGDGQPRTITAPVDAANEYFRFRIIPWAEEP